MELYVEPPKYRAEDWTTCSDAGRIVRVVKTNSVFYSVLVVM